MIVSTRVTRFLGSAQKHLRGSYICNRVSSAFKLPVRVVAGITMAEKKYVNCLTKRIFSLKRMKKMKSCIFERGKAQKKHHNVYI